MDKPNFVSNKGTFQASCSLTFTLTVVVKFDGNHVTLMGSVKSVESELLIVDDGTNKNITCNVEFSDMLDGISVR